MEFLTDTPREDSRGLCHALCLIAAGTLFFSTPEQFLESLDITTVLSTVILLRAFYDVTGTYAHPIELVAGWIAVISVGCALTTSNGWLALVLIMTGFIALSFAEIFATPAGVGPTIMILLFLSSRGLSLRAGARTVATRVFTAAFSVFDLFSVLTALGIDLTEREAKQPEGAIISFACWIAVIARWLAVVVFALNAQGSSPYKLVSSKDPMTDYARVITSSFSLGSKTRVKRPRAAALFQLLQLTCPLLTVAMAIATLLLPGEEGSNVSKKTADATRALKQASDVVAVASGVTGTGTPDFTEPDPEPVLDTAQKYAAYSLKYASSVLTRSPYF